MHSDRLKYLCKHFFLLAIALSSCFSVAGQYFPGDTTRFNSMLRNPEAQSDINYALLTASVNGDSLQIRWLLRYGADVETSTLEGNTPLIFAVANNRLLAVKILLESGANPNARNGYNESPLILAAKNNNLDITEYLIRDSADIQHADRYGATSLHYASVYGYFYMADMLLYYDADISKKTADGTTPLMAAVWSGSADVADLLIQNGASVNEKDNSGFTSLMVAAQNNDTLMMDLLIGKGDDLYEVNRHRYDALDIAIRSNAGYAIKYLLRKGNKWGSQENKAMNPYGVAAVYGRPQLAQVLKSANIPGKQIHGFDQISITASTLVCFHEYFTGVSISMREPSRNIGIRAGMDFKPFYTRVLVDLGENIFYQYYNKSYLAYAGVSKDFRLTDNPLNGNWHFTSSLSAGYRFGDVLRGTDNVPDPKFKIIPEAGLRWIKGGLAFEASLEYMKSGFYKVGPIWLRTGLSWSFFTNNSRSPGKSIRWY